MYLAALTAWSALSFLALASSSLVRAVSKAENALLYYSWAAALWVLAVLKFSYAFCILALAWTSAA